MDYISIQSSKDVIKHFGIKGMKWGHRNRRENLINRYMNKGYDPHTATSKAEKRLKTEKYLKRAALVGGVALGAYMGYKGANYIIDQRRAKEIARSLKKMNNIRESNSVVKKDKFGKLKSAGKHLADNILSIAQKKPGILGRRKLESIGSTKGKLGKIAENFAKAQSQVRTNSKAIDKIDMEALERVKKLMKK